MAQPAHTNGHDALAMLTDDHRHVRALFQQYADTLDPYLKQIIAEHVFAELTLHLLLEETVFYQAMAEADDAEGKRMVTAALQDHQQLQELMATLHTIDNDAGFEAGFRTLRDRVDTHVKAAETGLFPQATHLLAAHLEELAILLQERKAQLLAS